jgi:hypothetical protein
MHKKREATAAPRRRGRTLATAGIGVAAVAGTFALVAPANAATSQPTDPSINLNLPNQVGNNDTGGAPVEVTVDNSQSGNGKLENVDFYATVKPPRGVDCLGAVTLVRDYATSNQGSPVSAPLTLRNFSPPNTCVYKSDPVDIPANEVDNYHFLLNVDGTQPGHLASKTGNIAVAVGIENHGGTTLANDSGSTDLVNSSAPSFNSAPTKGATEFNAYSYDLVDSTGVSPTLANEDVAAKVGGTAGTTGYYAIGKYTDSGGNTQYTSRLGTDCSVTDGAQSCIIPLNKTGDPSKDYQFDFNATTGKIESHGSLSDINANPTYTWTIVANNDVGGLSSTDAGKAASGELKAHDVLSGQFQLPVLFSDVSQDANFAGEIYSLANNNVILGYADGSFKATRPLSRQAFVTFETRVVNVLQGKTGKAVKTDHQGACKTGTTSGFSDVSNNDQFCKQIRFLSRQGVIDGYKDGTFKPTREVSRQAISALLFREDSHMKGVQVGDATCQTPTPFNDVSADNIFCGDIEWLVNHDIAKGFNDGGFHPLAATTRQSGSAFFFRFGNFEKTGTFTSPFA